MTLSTIQARLRLSVDRLRHASENIESARQAVANRDGAAPEYESLLVLRDQVDAARRRVMEKGREVSP